MNDYIITFDIGGTRIKYGAVTLDGRVIKKATTPSIKNEGPEVLYEEVCKCIETIVESDPGKLRGIGLGLTGGVDPDLGVVLLPGKFKALEGYPIVPLLRKRFNIPVYADNDGRLAVYAEKYFGKAKNKKWAVIVTIGTGIGSGVVLDGKIPADPHLMLGTQLGHIIINKFDDRICLTGNAGTGEILCSATALALQVRSAIQRGISTVLSDEYFDKPFNIDFHKVIKACRTGDKLCLQELDTWINNLSVILINAVHCYSPEIIILSGGATNAADLYLSKLTEIVNKHIFRYPKHDTVEIVISDMQEYAGIMGAAAMMAEKLNLYNYD